LPGCFWRLGGLPGRQESRLGFSLVNERSLPRTARCAGGVRSVVAMARSRSTVRVSLGSERLMTVSRVRGRVVCCFAGVGLWPWLALGYLQGCALGCGPRATGNRRQHGIDGLGAPGSAIRVSVVRRLGSRLRCVWPAGCLGRARWVFRGRVGKSGGGSRLPWRSAMGVWFAEGQGWVGCKAR